VREGSICTWKHVESTGGARRVEAADSRVLVACSSGQQHRRRITALHDANYGPPQHIFLAARPLAGWCAFVLVMLVAIFFAWAYVEPTEENEHLVKVCCRGHLGQTQLAACNSGSDAS